MTIAARKPGTREALARSGAVMRGARLAVGSLHWVVTTLAVWLGLFWLDNLLELPAGLRLPLMAGAMLFTVAQFARRVAAPALRRQSVERTARLLESRYGIADNFLINAAQLENAPLGAGERVFAARTIERSSAFVTGIPLSTLRQSGRVRKGGMIAAALALAWIAYCCLLPRYAANALARLALPLRDIPPAGAIDIRVDPARDVTIAEGDDFAVQAWLPAAAAREAAPVVSWDEAGGAMPPALHAENQADLRAVETADGGYQHVFRRVRRSFAYRVFVGDSTTRSLQVRVLPLPRIRAASFHRTPPAYTGLPAEELPGPPAALSALPGSTLTVELDVDRALTGATWRQGGVSTNFHAAGTHLSATTVVSAAGEYELAARDALIDRQLVLARGEVTLETDRPPRVEFISDERNRFVNPGATLELDLSASDDFGVRDIRVTCREAREAGQVAGGSDATAAAARPETAEVLKEWQYIGPPGRTGEVKERLALTIAPDRFVPGIAYVVQAECRDFNPQGTAAQSRPIVLRVKSWSELGRSEDDALTRALTLLSQTIREQRQAKSRTGNARLYLEEALEKGTLATHKTAMSEDQRLARQTAGQAAEAFRAAPDGATYAAALQPLVDWEMAWALDWIARLPAGPAAAARPAGDRPEPSHIAASAGGAGKRSDALEKEFDEIARDAAKAVAKTPQEPLQKMLTRIEERQDYILSELVALLGRVSAERLGGGATAADRKTQEAPPAVTMEDAARQLKDALEDFKREQTRVIKKSQSLMDTAPKDLTEGEEEILGDLAREEAKWSKFFEEKLTDFSKLPLQEFADGSIAEEINEVYQEVKLAAKSLYEKNVELAVPTEQSGLEKAEELLHNLERWMPDTPDHLKWLMEEPLAPSDIPLAELPAELEDIVGELLDKEEEMSEDVEDVSSSWMDSIDKGAGWDAADGPISSMSAKGITGNQLPNEMEIGGRSGEGRTGRSSGQMVEETAEGKGGRETPTRLSPSPFETGSVKDSAKGEKGGATGGGKLSGYSEAGLRGPAPTPRGDIAARLADRQSQVRQEAEALSLKLRAYNLSSGDVEASILAMREFESSAAKQDGAGVRSAFSRILDTLSEARAAVRAETGLHRDASALPSWMRDEIMSGLRDGTPRGYEEMAAAYFRRLAEESAGEGGK